MSDIEMSLSFPLDSAGFFRRACPVCAREFKWHHDESRDDSIAPPDAYYCPYCRTSASPDEWFTEEQLAYIEDEVAERVVNPSLEGLADTMRQLDRASGGLIKGRLEMPRRDRAVPVFEPDDMREVKFQCHPNEPVKVADDWPDAVYCLICGEPTDASVQ